MKIALFADYHGGNRVWPLLEEALEDQRLDLIVFAGDILDSAEREAEWQKVRSTGKAPRKPQAESEQDGVIDELVYREFFINLTGFGVPIVFVPGHLDAPTARLNETVKGFTNAHNVQEKPFEMAGYTFIGWGGVVAVPRSAPLRSVCLPDSTAILLEPSYLFIPLLSQWLTLIQL
jgi:Icc-related predicted phosphoesterase